MSLPAEPERETTPLPARPAMSLLVVCQANVCRSPLIAFSAARSWPVIAASAGMQALVGAPLCAQVAAKISSMGEAGRRYSEGFRSRTVESMALDEYDLLLTATTELRGELVRRHPGQRDKSFAVLEALALSTAPLSSAERLELQKHGPAPVLLARRGSVAPGTPGPGGRHGPSWDISDGHNERRNRHHLATIEFAAKAGAELGIRMSDWSAAATSDRKERE